MVRQAIAFALTIAALAPAIAPAAANTGSDVQEVLDNRVDSTPGTGVVVGIIDNGKLTIYKAGDSGTARPLDEHTLFDVGSLSKAFAVNVLAQMANDGEVRLNDRADKYLPASARVSTVDASSVTLYGLATQHLASAGDQGDLLGFALARSAKTDFANLVRTRVFAPLQMTDSVVGLNATSQAMATVGHTIDGDVVHLPRSIAGVAGQKPVYSSLSDMLKYLSCTMGEGRIAKACSIPTGDGGHWGILELHGDSFGFRVVMMTTPDRSKGAVIMSNGPVVMDIVPHLINPDYPVTMMAPAAIDPVEMARYAGVYSNPNDGIAKLVVVQRDGVLYAQAPKNEPMRIYESRPDHFYCRVEECAIEFVHKDGGVVGLLLTQLDHTMPIFRLGVDGKPLASSLEPAFPPVIAVDDQTLHDYVGQYAFTTSLTENVTVGGGHVFVTAAGSPRVEIYPWSANQFFYKTIDAEVCFVRNSLGNVIGLVMYRNGRLNEAVKRP